MVCLENKAKILFGEARTPEAATLHNRKVGSLGSVTPVGSLGSVTLEASDDNYCLTNITASVTLLWISLPKYASLFTLVASMWVIKMQFLRDPTL